MVILRVSQILVINLFMTKIPQDRIGNMWQIQSDAWRRLSTSSECLWGSVAEIFMKLGIAWAMMMMILSDFCH